MKETIKPILIAFFEQTKTESLATSNYPKKYAGLKMKVGFGVGRVARIPWIAFLGNDQKPQNGIFPVFYFFKQHQKLILAYAISETEVPKKSWMLQVKETVESYFKKSNIHPTKFGSSYVYEVYDTNKDLDWNKIEKDLYSLITYYKSILLKK